MIKALKIFEKKSISLSKNYLLVGDNDFLYLYLKDQIGKNLESDTEFIFFDCSDKADKIESLINALGSQDLFNNTKFIISYDFYNIFICIL